MSLAPASAARRSIAANPCRCDDGASCETSTSKRDCASAVKSSGKIESRCHSGSPPRQCSRESRLARNSRRVLKFGGSSGHQMRGLNTPPRPAIRNPATSITLVPMSPAGKSTARLSKTASVSASLLPRIQRTSQPASNSGASICRSGTRSSQSPSRISVPGSCALQARRIGEKLPCGSPAMITPLRSVTTIMRRGRIQADARLCRSSNPG